MNDPEQSWPSYEAWQSEYPNALASFDAVLSGASGRRVVVFLDYDGTLTPIVSNPDAAVLSSRARETVRRLARVLPTAIISGRGREKVQEFVKLKELYYAGSHGMDIAGPAVDDGVDANGADAAGGAKTRLPSVTEGQAEGDPSPATEGQAEGDPSPLSADVLELVGGDVPPASLVTGDSPSARSAVECPIDRRAKRFGEGEEEAAGEEEGRVLAQRAPPPPGERRRSARISFAEDCADPGSSDAPATASPLPSSSDAPATASPLPSSSDAPATASPLPSSSDAPATASPLPSSSDAPATASPLPSSSDPSADALLPSLSSLLSGVSASGAPSAVFAQSLSARPAVGGSAPTPFASRAPDAAAAAAAARCPSPSDLADLDASPSPLPLPPRPLSSIRSMPACRALPLATSRSLPGDAATVGDGKRASDDAHGGETCGGAGADAGAGAAADGPAALASAAPSGALAPFADASDDSSLDLLSSPPIITRASLQSLASLPALPPLSGSPLPGPRGSGPSSAGGRSLRRSGASQPSLSAFQPAARFASLMDRLFGELTVAVRAIPGAAVEHNKFCLSVHFRNCPPDRVDDVRALVARAVAGEPELRITRGRKVLELRPKIDWDKGRAVVHVLKALGLARHQESSTEKEGELDGQGENKSGEGAGKGGGDGAAGRSCGNGVQKGPIGPGVAPEPVPVPMLVPGPVPGPRSGPGPNGHGKVLDRGLCDKAVEAQGGADSSSAFPLSNGSSVPQAPLSVRARASAPISASAAAPSPPVPLASSGSLPSSSSSGSPSRVALSSPDPDEWDAYAIYIGDDRTDEDAFRALKKLNAGVGIKVSSLPRPSEALWSLRDPDDVIAFLAKLEAWARGKHNPWRNKDVVCEGWTYRA